MLRRQPSCALKRHLNVGGLGPVAVADTASVAHGVAVVIPVLSNDLAGTSPLNPIVSPPTSGTATVNPTIHVPFPVQI